MPLFDGLKAFTSNVNVQDIMTPPMVAGDIAMLFAGSYNTALTPPSGWTQRFNSMATSTYTEHGALFTLVSPIDYPVGVHINRGGATTYSANIVLVFRPDSIYRGAAAAGGTSGAATPSFATSPSGLGRHLIFATQMTNGGTVPAFSLPAGHTLITTEPTSSYHRSSLYFGDTIVGPTVPSVQVNSNSTGGFIGGAAVVEGFLPYGRTHQMML
jgi:hypothetical protein